LCLPINEDDIALRSFSLCYPVPHFLGRCNPLLPDKLVAYRLRMVLSNAPFCTVAVLENTGKSSLLWISEVCLTNKNFGKIVLTVD